MVDSFLVLGVCRKGKKDYRLLDGDLLEWKKSPNRLVVDEATNDDNSIIAVKPLLLRPRAPASSSPLRSLICPRAQGPRPKPVARAGGSSCCGEEGAEPPPPLEDGTADPRLLAGLAATLWILKGPPPPPSRSRRPRLARPVPRRRPFPLCPAVSPPILAAGNLHLHLHGFLQSSMWYALERPTMLYFLLKIFLF